MSSTQTPEPEQKRRLFSRKPKKEKTAKKPNRFKQMWQVFQMTRRQNPASAWWMLLVLVLATAAGVGIGFVWGHPILTGISGLLLGVLLAMILLGRFAQAAAFEQIEGQPGAVGAALNSARRTWLMEDEPVAIDPRTQDLIFRATGRGGVVLVSEAPPHRAAKLLAKEAKRVSRVLPTVPVHTIQGGNGEGQVPLKRIPKEVNRIKPALKKAEVLVVRKRLAALQRSQLPIPKGVDPMKARIDRKAMRGR
ncbi:DUF4191 domain-containing protein [Sediminivirga luteola]|uniref:DUF4191 domain-containing protein n=1 Tax=Sediminivirga luteola TaxID=1774748 RepID=A0A8J2U054_9MICO|nr:DUF4191 domain-containing protein [Sediminivirga luteola]MCI2264000.1 DUF4191 domain-containing protein [Sediminivirga luteola]GGA23103.1 hypothetical protein GCM10011333_27700 [Sediminivirga luteola]